MSLVLRNKGKGMQRSSEQPLVGEERYVTTLITAAKETTYSQTEIASNRSDIVFKNTRDKKSTLVNVAIP